MTLLIVDGAGLYGQLIHYSLVICFVGSAFLIFFYLWKKGKLDMDEEPKWQMMKEEGHHESQR
jgi:hypothetical protein